MAEGDWLAGQFEASRSRLQSVAYRMLGSRAEAEDAVQDVWLRLDRADVDGIDNLGGWLTTVVARVCLDRLRSRRAHAETGDDSLPAAAGTADGGRTPEEEAVMAESLGAAMLVVLDALRPAERVAFVLHDVFAVPFDDIGGVLGQSPEAARQLASRARRRVRGAPATSDVDLPRQRSVVEAFLRAARGGDLEGLLRVLHPDVVMVPDDAALAMGSLRHLQGAGEVAARLAGGARGARLALVDGVAGFVWAPDGTVRGAVQLTVVDGAITRLDVTGDAARIAALDIVLLDA
jgi:RNA polymerase sigma-70 factor (ECF subfamily)